MNNEGNREPVYQDNIHPPDLILLNMNDIESSSDNPSSSVPSPDSPLSTPPDSPLRDENDGEANEDEKKREEHDKDHAKEDLKKEDIPEDECSDNNTGMKNTNTPNNFESEFPNDELQIRSSTNIPKETINALEVENKNSTPLLTTNGTSKPFDEVVKKRKEVEIHCASESAPDDEKKGEDPFIPKVPEVVRSNQDEAIQPWSSAETKNPEAENEDRDDKCKDQEPQVVAVSTKQIVADSDKSVDSHGELPSLSLIEKAKQRLSAHGLSDGTETKAAVSPSSKSTVRVKTENEKDVNKTSGDEINRAGSDNISSVKEIPSLSFRVEEAMRRTSMMVLKHSQRDQGSCSSKSPPGPTNLIGTTSVVEAVTTTDANTATKDSESVRLATLQRDIMSLKSSLSNMNMQLKENEAEEPNTASRDKLVTNKIKNKDGELGAGEIKKSEDSNSQSSIDNYNDIPSPAKIVPTTEEHAAYSEQQKAALVSPDGEADGGEPRSCDTIVETDTVVAANDAFPSNCDNLHIIPHTQNENEIMNTNTGGPLLSEPEKKFSSKNEGNVQNLHNDIVKNTESQFSRDKSNNYREMTPKKDLQGSDNSARWLEQELRRRAGIKNEINAAIEERGRMSSQDNDANKNRFDVDKFPSISSPPEIQNSQSTTDEEVAAITANDVRNRLISNRSNNLPSPDDEEEPPSLSKSNVNGKISRKLDYGDFEELPDDELMDRHKSMAGGTGDQGFKPLFDYQDIQHEMKKFASETRAALREQSFLDPSSSAVPVAFSSPLSVNHSLNTGASNNHPDFQMNTVANPRVHDNKTNNMESISINFAALNPGEVPKLLISMDSFDGIASGDIFLSLLSESTARAETSAAATWADRVHGATWRARRMRKSMMQGSPEPHTSHPLVRGGSQTVASVQQAALLHLKRDEIDDSINLVEGIVFAYYSYFERSLNFREKNPTADSDSGMTDFKPYIGMALHNLGILNLLKGDYDEALSYFTRAVENRKGNLGDGHPHYISSLVRLSVCRYALNEFAEAHAGLEEALACAKRTRSTTLEGRLQVAEILNNLGCLAYMSGQPTTASSYYRDSMDIQFGALTDSLYLGNATSGKSISLNISIARANIGFIKLVTKDLAVAITALENALMEQQILLRGIDDTLIATMDHLALSNLLVGSQEKAALMYNRILTLQQNEYGPNDRRCFVTIEKMNMVQGKGVQYEGAIEELRKTFSIDPVNSSLDSSQEDQGTERSPKKEKHAQTEKVVTKNKKKKGLKALTLLMKKSL